ncbi:hypothetical protein GCM10017788_04270 [Amycolatopsis acidiphila]|nr:hypothetical protein GCM10017788_04270 [Amycolatopsis acidiphila]
MTQRQNDAVPGETADRPMSTADADTLNAAVVIPHTGWFRTSGGYHRL